MRHHLTKGATAMIFEIGDQVKYSGGWGSDAPVFCTITGTGWNKGQRVYDNNLGNWGYAHQYTLVKAAPDPTKLEPIYISGSA